MSVNHLLKLIELYPEKNWVWSKVFENPNMLGVEIHVPRPEYISVKTHRTWEEIERRWKVNGRYLYSESYPESENPNITWEIVQNNPKFPWEYKTLSRNPNITWEIVQSNDTIPWDWFFLSENPNITWEIVQNNPQCPWKPYFLSANPNITWEIVKENLTKIKWNFSQLSSNPGITLESIRDNPQYPWDWEEVSRNPNLTWEFVRDDLESSHPKSWDWWNLSRNEFEKHPVLIKRRELACLEEVFKEFYTRYNHVEKRLKEKINSFLF